MFKIITISIFKKTVLFSVIILALLGLINSSVALILGFLYTLLFQTPKQNKKLIGHFLKISVVGLGFGMFITETWEASKTGFTLTLYSIVLTLVLGLLMGKILNLDKKLSHLITSGTSICGGSAIAAISPVIKADYKTISVALIVVFLLNSIALIIFPILGQLLDLSQNQFGLWCAVAIHDTSSVVGAAMSFGDEALRIATIVKLARALWIIPISILSMIIFRTKGEKIRIPYFIFAFIGVVFINSYIVIPTSITEVIVMLSKRLLVVTLFLVGTTLSISYLKETGIKPILFAVLLWLSISIFSLVYILN